MLKILGKSSSSNVQKVLWCCGELAVPFEHEQVGGEFGGNDTPAYLKLNPNGLVPTMIEDGFVLWESNSIVRYLAAKYGTGGLWPQDIRVAASASRWMDWQLSAMNPLASVLFRALYKTPRDDIAAANLGNALRQAGQLWQMLDEQLARTAYVASDELTVGDISLGNAIFRWFDAPIDRPKLANLQSWYQRLCERPAYVNAVCRKFT